MARKPSHLGSNRKPACWGSSSAILASMGSIGGVVAGVEAIPESLHADVPRQSPAIHQGEALGRHFGGAATARHGHARRYFGPFVNAPIKTIFLVFAALACVAGRHGGRAAGDTC